LFHQGVRIKHHIQIWATTTDAGSDEAKARRLRQVLVKDNLFHWEFDSDCFMHQYQLLVHGCLRVLDASMVKLGSTRKYWSSLAKIMNVWRDSASDLFQHYRLLYGDQEALRCASRVPPRPLSGRWGSCTACERHVLKAGVEKLHRAFSLLFTPAALAAGEAGAAARGGLDELSAEEMRAHKDSQGKHDPTQRFYGLLCFNCFLRGHSGRHSQAGRLQVQ